VRPGMAISKPIWRAIAHFARPDEAGQHQKSTRVAPARTLRSLASRVHQIHFPRRAVMSMGNRAVWAALWVIGIPLPILLILYMITGGGCNSGP
jgi:hypothetical protein